MCAPYPVEYHTAERLPHPGHIHCSHPSTMAPPRGLHLSLSKEQDHSCQVAAAWGQVSMSIHTQWLRHCCVPKKKLVQAMTISSVTYSCASSASPCDLDTHLMKKWMTLAKWLQGHQRIPTEEKTHVTCQNSITQGKSPRDLILAQMH